MSEAAILGWLESSLLGESVRNYQWFFPILETIHFAALCVLLGSLLILELRLLGFAKQVPIRSAMKFIPLALIAFAINLITGIGLFSADPFNYWSNPGFHLKMALIVLAGCNALAFEFWERKYVVDLPVGADANGLTKFIAGASLCLWIAVISLGRLLPYSGGTGG